MSRHDDIPLRDWNELDQRGLREWAAQYQGWATTDMSDAEELRWTLVHQFPVSEFRSMSTDWAEYHADDVSGNPRYGDDFGKADWHTPIVISIEDDNVIIWDGWHRIATSIVRGDECIMAIVGRKGSVS